MGSRHKQVALEKREQDRARKIGARIRARRTDLGISQEKLAECIGVTFQQVQKYEKGINRIAVTRIPEIAEALEWKPAAFFEGMTNDDLGEQDLRVETLASITGGKKMINLLVNLPEPMRSQTIKFFTGTLESLNEYPRGDPSGKTKGAVTGHRPG